MRVTAVPGFDAPALKEGGPIQSTDSADKAGLTVLQGRQTPAAIQASGGGQFTQVNGTPTTDSYLYNVVGGGDFEEPAWSSIWSHVWLGSGRPVVTHNSQFVVSGQQSLWLGGSDTDNSLWYPVSFPDTIDSTQPSELKFLFQMRNLDLGYDTFCVAVTNESGETIGGLQDCYRGPADGINPGVTYQYTRTFTSSDRSRLQGKTGYIVLYTQGDHFSPHMSTFVDDVRLTIDYRSPTLGGTPGTGPAGTTFLLEGKHNLPYSAVAICPNPCNGSNAYEIVYADAKGDIQAYLESTPDTVAGQYQVQSRDIAGRTAKTTLTVHSSSPPQVTANPTSGLAGTKFSFTGTNVVPANSRIAVIVNGTFLGVVGSDTSGAVVFTIQTTCNTPAATYNLLIIDRAGRSASTTYQVISAPTGSPTMTVTPKSGPAGSSFTFHGSNFASKPGVTFALDNQPIGQATVNADGTFAVTLNTATTIPPGTYTLVAAQGSRRASARFQITGGSSGPSGNGIYATLAWTDPPAQANAASALINNLDLRIDGPGGPYFGNGGSGPDSKNNVETIRLEQPAAGTYTISVKAAAVDATFGAQPFALIATTTQNFGANSSNVGLRKQVFLPVMRR